METTELKVIGSDGKEAGVKSVAADVFSGKISSSVLHQVVRWQRARKRAGTHTVKTRAEVRGGGKKPWRQKGLGRARAGSLTSPVFVGGGVAHGPKMRDYGFRINKKERKLALTGAMSSRNAEGRLLVLAASALSEAKAKEAQRLLSSMGIQKGTKVLVVLCDEDRNEFLGFRNLEGVTVVSPQGLNVYDILGSEYMIIAENALAGVEGRFGGAQ